MDERIAELGASRVSLAVIAILVPTFTLLQAYDKFLAIWICLAVLGLAALLLGFVATVRLKDLRSENDDLVLRLHEYARALQEYGGDRALRFHRQSDEVVISKRGNASISRKIFFHVSSSDIPHFVTSGFDADKQITDRERRRVKGVAELIRGESAGIRLPHTLTWKTTVDGYPMLVLSAFLSKEVKEGDIVHFDVIWPGASRELRNRRRAERFVMRFTKRAFPFTCRVVLKHQSKEPGLTTVGGARVKSGREGRHWVYILEEAQPQLGAEVGFAVDLR